MSTPAGHSYRSQEWFNGTDEVALLHRAALRSTGHRINSDHTRPLIGISTSHTDLNPCNTVLADRVEQISAGITAAGGVALPFPTMSLGEDLMKPSAMLYRNLLAMEVEEYLRSYPLDGVVITGNCDKSVPGALMGALSADLPTVVYVGGARSPACLDGRELGTTDIWRLWQDRQAGQISAERWDRIEDAFSQSTGACNVMGTASTVALVVETLGLLPSGSALVPAADRRGADTAREAGRLAVQLTETGLCPSAVLSAGSFHNAAVVLSAVGGSTNVIIHLLALAGRAGIKFTLDDLHTAGRDVGVLTDVAPSGSGLIQQLHRAGGLPVLLRELAGRLDLYARTVDGHTIGEIVRRAGPAQSEGTSDVDRVIRPLSEPVVPGPAIEVIRGSLAPDGAVLKRSAASPHLLRHRGRAVVFDDYHDMRRRIDDPQLDVDAASVLVMRGCGPVGAPGMPEWGMVPIPSRLARAGVSDMVRLTDARMSGTSFGTVVLHAAPESAIGGPIALVRDGDLIELDVHAHRVDLLVDDDVLAARRSSWRSPPSEHERGWPALYRAHVQQASQGCDLDFLAQPVGRPPHLVAPVVGRS